MMATDEKCTRDTNCGTSTVAFYPLPCFIGIVQTSILLYSSPLLHFLSIPSPTISSSDSYPELMIVHVERVTRQEVWQCHSVA